MIGTLYYWFSMNAADRRYFSWLGIVFGPLLIAAGFGFAFTNEGALMIWTGSSMLVAGIGLRTRLSLWVVGASLSVGIAAMMPGEIAVVAVREGPSARGPEERPGRLSVVCTSI